MMQNIINKAKSLPRRCNLAATNLVHQVCERGEYTETLDLLRRHHAAGGLANPVQLHKLHSLRLLLEEHQPQSIIEFGSGLSTCVLSAYAQKTGANVVSLDEEERWAENTRNLIGNNTNVQVIVAPRIICHDKLPIEIKYDYTPQKAFDMAIIDGPNLKVNGVRLNAINTNINDLLERPRVILVDGRTETVKYLSSFKGYKASLSDLKPGKFVWPGYRHFSVFTQS